MFGTAVVSFILAVRGGKPLDMPISFFYYFGAVIGLFGLIPLGMLRASLRPTAWLARCNSKGIIIKFRSYLNWKLPAEGLQAVEIDWNEIAWARLVKERRATPGMSSRGGNSTEIKWTTYIDLALVNPDLSTLETHLQSERNLRPEGKAVSLDYPVQTQTGGIVEISWSDGIAPSAHKAIAIIGQRVKLADPEHRVVDLTHQLNASPDEDRNRILQLAKSGDQMAAVQLAQQCFGYNLSQANDYVEKLLADD
jgi:hypothetical protein